MFEEEDDSEENYDLSKSKVIQMVTDDVDLEDFRVKTVVTHSYEKGLLYLLVELETGEFLLVSFSKVKKNYPEMIARYILAHNVGRKYIHWAKAIFKYRRRAIRRLYFICGADRAYHIKVRRNSKPKKPPYTKSKSKNTKNAVIKLREKFGIWIPNNVNEVILLDKLNSNSK